MTETMKGGDQSGLDGREEYTPRNPEAFNAVMTVLQTRDDLSWTDLRDLIDKHYEGYIAEDDASALGLVP